MRLRYLALAIICAGAVAGIVLLNSAAMFYNLLILPAIGGLSRLSLKQKWYATPVGVFLLTCLWQVRTGAAAGLSRDGAVGILFFSAICAGLVGLGAVIAALLLYAGGKEGEKQ